MYNLQNYEAVLLNWHWVLDSITRDQRPQSRKIMWETTDALAQMQVFPFCIRGFHGWHSKKSYKIYTCATTTHHGANHV